MATLREILAAAIDTAKVQPLFECVLGARRVLARKGTPSHTRVEFATTHMTPDDLIYFSGELGRPATRKPAYIGIVVWVPTEIYERMTA